MHVGWQAAHPWAVSYCAPTQLYAVHTPALSGCVYGAHSLAHVPALITACVLAQVWHAAAVVQVAQPGNREAQASQLKKSWMAKPLRQPATHVPFSRNLAAHEVHACAPGPEHVTHERSQRTHTPWSA